MQPAQGVVDRGDVSGAVTLDASAGAVFKLTLVGNTTLTVKNVRAGGPCVVLVTQDGVGSRTLAWNGAGGQTVSGFTTVVTTAGATSAFVLWGTANDLSSVYATTNPSSGGGAVSSIWENLGVSGGTTLFQRPPMQMPGAGPIVLDCSAATGSANFIVGPLVANVTLTFTGLQAGHTYKVTIFQATAGEVGFSVTSYSPTPVTGTYCPPNSIPNDINSVAIRVYYSTNGSDLYIIGGNDFIP